MGRCRQLEAEVEQNEVTQRVATKERDLAPHSPIPSLTFTELFATPIRLPALDENYSFLPSFIYGTLTYLSLVKEALPFFLFS